jgi:hypothetical protein
MADLQNDPCHHRRCRAEAVNFADPVLCDPQVVRHPLGRRQISPLQINLQLQK